MSQSNDTSFADYLDSYTFESILERMLSKIPDSIDKREGSVIWDALAPAAVELAKMYIELKGILINTYPATAVGKYLDLKVQERGLERLKATYAIKLGTFVNKDGSMAEIPIGSRFSSVSDTNPINYRVTAKYADSGIEQAGKYELTCEEAGTAGNNYVGNLLPISNLPDLKSATMSDLLIPARDEETDDELYDRFLEKINATSFGGNITQYREWVLGIAGVGAVQVHPVWNGGGSVKVSIIGSDFNAASPELISLVQEELDPTPQGTGLGLAPIGHTVTVATATKKTVNVELDVMAETGYNQEQLKGLVTPVLENYFLATRKKWDNSNDYNSYNLGMYRANIISEVIAIPQILNITDVKLNGASADLKFIENGETQELPILGTVTINVQE